MENPIEIVPESIVLIDDMECLGDALSAGDHELTCDYCGRLLTTEVEAMNCVCLACMNEDMREAKIRSIDDLAYASRAVLSLVDVIGEDIRPSYRSKWEMVSSRLCIALRSMGDL